MDMDLIPVVTHMGHWWYQKGQNCFYLSEKSHFTHVQVLSFCNKGVCNIKNLINPIEHCQRANLFTIWLLSYLCAEISDSLSILTVIFQVNLGQPVFLEAKDDGDGGDNWTTGAISRAKLQPNHRHQETNIQFFTGRMPFLSPNHSVKALKEKRSHSMDLLTRDKLNGVFQLYL